jgi:hypothetical protein
MAILCLVQPNLVNREILFPSITLLTLLRGGQYNSINYAHVFFRNQSFITNKF